MVAKLKKNALIIIDVQRGFDEPVWGKRNNVAAEANILKILTYWREHTMPIIHIRHDSSSPTSPLHPSNKGNAFKSETAPLADEIVFSKSTNSAFIGTPLQSYLEEETINDLVITGLTTDHCVSTTTRMAGNLGFSVRLVADATATFERTDRHGNHHTAEAIHTIHLASLDGEFCQVVDTNDLIQNPQ